MRIALTTAAALLVLIAIAHSVLGERYILMRLFRRQDLPHLFGNDSFTRRTLRFAWHITSVAWAGFAVVLVLLAEDRSPRLLLPVISATFLVTAAMIVVGSRGRHLAWIVFTAIAILIWIGA